MTIMANRLVDIIPAQAGRYGEREAYRFCWRKDGEWQKTSWNELRAQVDVAGKALACLGLVEKDTIAICSPNTPQIFITELGAFQNRLAAIPLYSSSSQEQFDFIVSNGGARDRRRSVYGCPRWVFVERRRRCDHLLG